MIWSSSSTSTFNRLLFLPLPCLRSSVNFELLNSTGKISSTLIKLTIYSFVVNSAHILGHVYYFAVVARLLKNVSTKCIFATH